MIRGRYLQGEYPFMIGLQYNKGQVGSFERTSMRATMDPVYEN
jgi:hypothetical protein